MIELYGGGIIKKSDKSPYSFTNQAGGYACEHTSVTGYKLDITVEGIEEKLLDYFIGPKHKGWCCEGIDEYDAQFIDQKIQSIDLPFKVDRDKLKESMEAWVYLEDDLVLYWPNSD